MLNSQSVWGNECSLYILASKNIFWMNHFLNGRTLEVVVTSVKLGSTKWREGFNAEMRSHLRRWCICKFWKTCLGGGLEVFPSRQNSVFANYVLMKTLLYLSEMWTTYRFHIQMLEGFHQKFFTRILGVKWECFIPDTEYQPMTQCYSIEYVIFTQMWWSGHANRMKLSNCQSVFFSWPTQLW